MGDGLMLRRYCSTICISTILMGGFIQRPAVAAASASVDAAAESDALAEITVTAEKQTQNLQKTAAAVTAISADTLIEAGVGNLIEAEKLVPSVRFQAEGDNTQVFIRGVGANLDFPNVEPNVAFNFAAIYMPRRHQRRLLRRRAVRSPPRTPGHSVRPKRNWWNHQRDAHASGLQ